jgi:hypothetical protein
MALTNFKIRKLLEFYYLEEPALFSQRRDINWRNLRNTGCVVVVCLIVALLAAPDKQPERETFSEPVTTPSDPALEKGGATITTKSEVPLSFTAIDTPPTSPSIRTVLSASKAALRKTPKSGSFVVIMRPGYSSSSHLPPGTRIEIELTESVSVAAEAIPLIGIVSENLTSHGEVMIPARTTAYGDVVFDGAKRARINWKHLELPDGRTKTISAAGIGKDGRMGIDGNVHSEALKNTAGQMLTRFVGAYAAGSMQTGMLGGSPGGNRNGMRNAVAETARDRSEAFAEDLKTEDRWIELEAGEKTTAILLEPFMFDELGGGLR